MPLEVADQHDNSEETIVPGAYFHTLSAEELNAIGWQLEQAIDDHNRWLKQLHRSLICHLPVNPADLQRNAHCCCRFGKWYYGKKSQEFFQHPLFAEIGALHKAMHDKARELGMYAQNDTNIPQELYDIFIGQQMAFSKQLLMLRNKITGYRYMVDPLLDIPGRRVMYPVLLQEYERSVRTGHPCSVVLIDLDHFKNVNDTYGHACGDKVLQSVANFIKGRLRIYDSLFRYGGEEFLICLPDTSVEEAAATMERVRDGLAEQAINVDGTPPLHITVSMGIAEMLEGVTFEQTIECADEAMYSAKEQGRNQVRIFEGKCKPMAVVT